MNLVIAILSGFLAIRDGVMPQDWREVFLAKYIPQLPWYMWALVCAVSLLVFVFFVVPSLHHKAILAHRTAYRKRLRENELLHGVRHLVRERVVEAKEKDSKPPEETRPKARPIFSVLPQTAFAGLLELDVNVFRKTNKTKDTFYPIIVSLENVPRPEAFNETDEVWAHITYRERGFGDMELERANSGCWVDELLPDVSFPFHKPRHLILGVWRVNGKKPVKNDFRVFEYSRELHRPVEKSGFEAPRNLLIDVVLTPNGHHELSCKYQFDIDLTSPANYRLNRYKLPARPESKVEEGENPERDNRRTQGDEKDEQRRAYIIKRLQELISLHDQLPTGWIDSDDPRFGMARAFSRDAERFLAQYFDEAHVKRFKERGQGVVFLEKLLFEYLK